MIGRDFERELIAVIADYADSRGIKQKPLAEKAWPYKNSASSIWRRIRNGGGGLGVDDAYNMALALGISFLDVCAMAQAKMLQKSAVNVDAGSTLETPVKKNPEIIFHSVEQFTHNGAAN